MKKVCHNLLGALQMLNSSFWITVFIVRVGCIIEAQAQPINSNSDLDIIQSPYALQEAAKPSAFQDLKKKRFLASSRNLGKEENSSLGSSESENSDTCADKKDGYYTNLSSSCSGYYFCAAGYQISYVCPPNTYFNGEKCTSDYKCEIGAPPTANPCHNRANGYYPMKHSPRKYFYCYHRAKVIELSCSEGKYYNRNEKTCMTMATSSQQDEQQQSNLVVDEKQDCVNRRNGFYTILSSNCTKYYFCVQGEKTELECQANFVFNGQLCVARSQFTCPNNRNTFQR